MKTIAIIYHDADFDGVASNEVCRYHLRKLHPEAIIHSYGWDYGRPSPVPSWEIETTHMHNGGLLTRIGTWPDYDAIYIVDLSVDELMRRHDLRDKIVWIDHHKSAIEKWDRKSDHSAGPGMFTGLRIDGVAACRLCWQWFIRGEEGYADEVLSKQLFVNRTVSEPRVLTLLGEYDVWDRRDDNADVLQYGIRSIDEIGGLSWAAMFEETFPGTALLSQALDAGRAARNYARTVDAQNARAAYLRTLFDIPMIVLNGRGNSKTFDSALERFPEASALCLWYYDGNKVKVSLYHHPKYTDIDLSVFAKQMGGGGHKGACGFTMPIYSLWFNEELT